MNIWMILSAILLLIAILFCVYWQKAVRQRDINAARLQEMESLRAEMDRLRTDDYQCHRRIDTLNNALSEERAYSENLEGELDENEKCIAALNQRIEQANALRTRAEKDASGALMKAQLYERQYDQLRDEHRLLEKRYQDSKEECRRLTAQASDNAKKRKAAKTEQLDQISMRELFDL